VPKLTEVLSALQRWYPAETAESWDAVGLACGDPQAHVERVLVAIDCVPLTVAEAIDYRAQLLLTHHPLLLSGVHGVPVTDPKGAMIHRMIRSEVAHFVAHTNADIALHGVSEALALRLGLTELRPLDYRPGARVGSGRIGVLAESCSLADFTTMVARALPSTVWGVRAAGHPDQLVRSVAVCGGSGGGYAELARAAGADVFVTSDLKHHSTLEAVAERTADTAAGSAPMALLDAAHWATEQPWLEVVAELLRAEFAGSLEVLTSELVTDPWTVHAS
jgi:dinuclear metal center YbgI/SA1388 family protein